MTRIGKTALSLAVLVSALGGCQVGTTGPEPLGPDAGVSVKEDNTDPEPEPEPEAPPCEEGDERTHHVARKMCYSVHFEKMTRDDAQANCEALGGQLAQIDDIVENSVVSDLAELAREVQLAADPQVSPAYAYDDYWLGGSDKDSEGSWRWADGTEYWNGGPKPNGTAGAFENWRINEPNDGNSDTKSEDCMIVEADNPVQTWDDRPCEREYSYICERSME